MVAEKKKKKRKNNFRPGKGKCAVLCAALLLTTKQTGCDVIKLYETSCPTVEK